jgi:hypothetical protein
VSQLDYTKTLKGYAHPDYADSLAEFGTPRELPLCGGWILERQIPGFPYRDAMGCYPLFLCQDWSQLYADLEKIGNELVSLSIVTDPFGKYDEALLHRCFDLVIPFKQHFIVDLRRSRNEIARKRHREYARQALKKVQVSVWKEPTQFAQEWIVLYDTLIKKYDIQGIRAFSRTAFAKQLDIPGALMVRAVHQDVAVGAQLYFLQGDVVYYHLGAYNTNGYDLRAAYALHWFSIEYFSGKARWLNLGGGGGITDNNTNGLSQFKRGWATDTRTVYFCGRIFNHQRCAEIMRAKNITSTNYFPAYREGEFT